jgi:transcriptional regulator with XRE-family HTH domain
MYLRLPMRVGKAVTQEEVAEAVGISRQWYAVLEGDHRVRVSATVLGRIADALMMDTAERASLFELAIPEIRSASLTDRSAAVLDALEPVRRFTRALWAATTEAEALALVREHAMAQLVPDVVATSARLDEGGWEYAATYDADEPKRRNQFLALLRERWGPAIIDDLYCYTLLAQPGDLVTRTELDAWFPERAAMLRPAVDAAGRSDVSVAMANIRSAHGFLARLLTFHKTGHEYSTIERAHLSTLADLTSLALSGRI